MDKGGHYFTGEINIGAPRGPKGHPRTQWGPLRAQGPPFLRGRRLTTMLFIFTLKYWSHPRAQGGPKGPKGAMDPLRVRGPPFEK